MRSGPEFSILTVPGFSENYPVKVSRSCPLLNAREFSSQSAQDSMEILSLQSGGCGAIFESRAGCPLERGSSLRFPVALAAAAPRPYFAFASAF
jgi:hypothetical protein